MSLSITVILTTVLFAADPVVSPIPPPHYYDTVNLLTRASTITSLNDIITAGHIKIPYTSSTTTDTWDVLEIAQEYTGDPSLILDVYKNAVYPKAGGGNVFYQREHTWPNSYGFPNDVVSNFAYTDLHALWLADSSYNASRGNTLYRSCDTSCSEKTTDENGGQGGGAGVYPGNSNWRTGSGATGTWEVWQGRRGDVARAVMYMAVRYDGEGADPDLRLTNDEGQVVAASSNQSIAYFGILDDIVDWSRNDTVDVEERVRHEIVYTFQHNRNPFVDHPEWVTCAFVKDCQILFQDGFENGDLDLWQIGDSADGTGLDDNTE